MPLIKPTPALAATVTTATTTLNTATAAATAATTSKAAANNCRQAAGAAGGGAGASAAANKRQGRPTAKSMPVTPVQPKSPCGNNAYFTDFGSDNVYDVYEYAMPHGAYANYVQHDEDDVIYVDDDEDEDDDDDDVDVDADDDDDDDDADDDDDDADVADDQHTNTADNGLDDETSSMAMITPPPPYDTPHLPLNATSAGGRIVPPPPPPRRFLFGNRELFSMSPATPSAGSLASAITPTKLSAAAAAMFAGPQMAQLNRKWTNLHRKRRRRNSSTDDSKELDKLVLQSVDWDDNDMY